MRDFEEDIEFLFINEIKSSDDFCEDLWSSMANVEWLNKDGSEFSCTFRYAGGLIADIREEGSYMDWYCSGEYATVSEEIENKMKSIGWAPVI